MSKLIAVITNYNHDANARQIYTALQCPAVIVDSSGIPKSGFTATDKPFAAGCIEKALEIFLASTARRCLLICSDVIGNWSAIVDKINILDGNIGIYTPSVYGQGWAHEKPTSEPGLRDIPFAEGMIICINRHIAEKIVSRVSFKGNPHCYGVDVYMGYLCKALCYRCVADNDVCVYHPFGSAYSQKEAEVAMEDWCRARGLDFYEYCLRCGMFAIFYIGWWRKLVGMFKINR